TSWISILSGASGSGSGTTTLTYSVASTSSARSGSMTIAGQTFTVTQSGPSVPPCSYTVNPQSASMGGAGGSGSVNISGSPSGCIGSWSAFSNTSWITITSVASGTGSGSFTL